MHATTAEPAQPQVSRRRLTPRRGLRVLRPAHEASETRHSRRDPETQEDLQPAARRGDPALATLGGPPARLVGAASDPLRFGRFAVLGRIGEGAMSTVYAAHDPALGRKVAVKLVHDDGDLESRARARLEAHALARISHPNVVQIYEVGSHGLHTFVAMEYIEGVTLTAWQAERRSLAEVLKLYVQAGRGLVAAHAAGIVHRDFKSDNVLIGRDGRARVVDFGLALLMEGPQPTATGPMDDTASPRLTSSGTVMGTPAYMSPEQHRGATIDERSDQFNFCAALYEALYRVRPFAGNTLREVASQVRGGILQSPARGMPISRPVHRALLRGLAARPGQRWRSLAELLDHLEAIEVAPHVAPRGLSGFLAAIAGAGVWALVLGWALGLSQASTTQVAGLNVALVVLAALWLTSVRIIGARRLTDIR
jgi:predicted Ser/Thr protein kinase